MLYMIEEWFAKRWLRKQLIQGGHHKAVRDLFVLLKEYAKDEFTEDTTSTIEEFLADQLKAVTSCGIYTQSDVEDLLKTLNNILVGEFGIAPTFIDEWIRGKYYLRYTRKEVSDVSRNLKRKHR